MADIEDEYRPSMDAEVLHSWAKDAVAVIQELRQEVVSLSDELRAANEEVTWQTTLRTAEDL